MRLQRGYLKVVAAALIWGTIGAFARWSGLNPLELSFFRLLIAGFVLSLLLPPSRRRSALAGKGYLLLFLAGVLFAADSLFFFWALQLTTITNAVLPYNIQPVMIALLAPCFLKERPERGLIPVLLVSLLGLLILVFPTLSEYSRSDLAGIGLALAGTFFLSVITLITRLLKVDAATFVYYEMFIAVFCLLFFLKPSRPLDWHALAMVAVIGLVHTALGYILYYDGLSETKMQYAATLTYITPVTAVLTGYFFFHEAITPFALVGGGLIMANSIMVTLKK